MNSVKRIVKNPYFIITSVYLLAHFFLLILSGCWWDDWTFMSHDLTYVSLVANGSGRPEWNILIPLCWSLTNNGRILIFFLYYLDSLFVYNILKDSSLFDDKASLLITLLFIIIPVNDARLLISNFPYSVGLFFFYLAFMLFVKWNNSDKKVVLRIGILLLFFVSFILSSLLAFYYVIFAYLFVIELKKSNEDKAIKKILMSIKNIIIKYLDFFVLPFVFFIFNKLAFPITETGFEARASISLIGLVKCVKYLPLSIINILKETATNLITPLAYIPVLIILVILTVVLFVRIKNTKEFDNKKKSILYLVYGFVVLILGLFIYVEVRTDVIVSNGVKGRDSILTPLGVAIIIYSIISLLNNKYKKIICVITILLGIASFNLLYIEWQKDYYQQLSIESLIDNKIVKDNDTFFLANLNESDIEAERYYSLNINANHVFNDETRLFIPKVSNLYMLNEESIDAAIKNLNYSSLMRDYDPEDYYFDAILVYSNDLETKYVIKLKYNELFNNEEFEKGIVKMGDMEISEVDDDFTKLLLDKYKNGLLKDDNDVVNLLMNYNN